MNDHPVRSISLQQSLLEQYSLFLSSSLPSPELNRMYDLLRGCIEECLNIGNFSRHVVIRVRAWLDILDKENYGPVQLSNRSNYARLLHLMLQCDHVTKPFSTMPGETTSLLQKQEYHEILQEVERYLKKSRITSRKSSQMMSPSASYVSKSTCKQRTRQLSKNKNWSKSSFNTTFTKKKQSTQCSKSKIFRPKENHDLGQSRQSNTVENVRVNIGKLLKNQYEENYYDDFGKKQTQDEENFDQIAGMKMSNFISRQLKQFIQKNPPKGKQLNSTHQFYSNNNFSSADRVVQTLSLKISKAEERYWQSNSINDLGTPKYLSALRDNPYASLIISDEDAESNGGGTCECLCNLFKKNKTEDRQF